MLTHKFIHAMRKPLTQPIRAVWRWMQCLVLRLRCDHKWEWVRNIYGDEINHVSVSKVYRSWWKCPKCGKSEPRQKLHKENVQGHAPVSEGSPLLFCGDLPPIPLDSNRLEEDFSGLLTENLKLKEALRSIRDYRPNHCMGDFGLQAEDIFDNTSRALDSVRDLID